MRKEIIFAIVLGLILGGVIIYGAQLANQSSQRANKEISPTPSEAITDTETPSPTPSAAITITSPQDHSVISTSTTTVTGNAKPNSSIIVYDDSDQSIATADATGLFSTTLKLDGGQNVINVSSLSNNMVDSASITVIYTTAKIE